MMYKTPNPKFYLLALCLSCSINIQVQTNFTDKIAEWKTTFPKEEVVATLFKEVIDFSLNTTATATKEKVKASVSTQTVLVPVKDYIKYEDGLFWNLLTN